MGNRLSDGIHDKTLQHTRLTAIVFLPLLDCYLVIHKSDNHHQLCICLCRTVYICISGAVTQQLFCTRDSIRWLYSCDNSSHMRSVYSQCHVILLKCTEQNVNNQTLIQVSQLYFQVFFCLKVIRS